MELATGAMKLILATTVTIVNQEKETFGHFSLRVIVFQSGQTILWWFAILETACYKDLFIEKS